MKSRKLPKGVERASRLERLDAAAAKRAAEWRDAPPVRIAGLLSDAADQPPLFAAGGVVLATGLAAGQPKLARLGVRLLASEALATGMKALVKRHVARTRPRKAHKDGRYVLRADKDGDRNEGPWNSFPSGHTAGAVATARAVMREYPGAALPAGGAAAAVAAVQLPKGAHFPSDVVAGAAIGLVAEAAADGLIRLLRARLARA